MVEGSIETRDVFVLGDNAFATGTWKFSIGPIGKKAKTRSGRFVDVWVREGTGRWMKWRDVGVPN
jgi:ketosteroid isomerase-like protein